MIVVALGVLVLAILVALGRKPLMAKARGRQVGFVVAGLAAACAAYDAARGGWLGGSILLTAALWIATSSRPRRDQRPSGEVSMSRKDAASMLGVAEAAPRVEIDAAYRRLMARVHPDVGGAAGLAAQLNAARERMLRAG